MARAPPRAAAAQESLRRRGGIQHRPAPLRSIRRTRAPGSLSPAARSAFAHGALAHAARCCQQLTAPRPLRTAAQLAPHLAVLDDLERVVAELEEGAAALDGQTKALEGAYGVIL